MMNFNLGLSPAWWLLLPLLILPIWWLRQRRETLVRKTLATAKFLAPAKPQLVRVWRWREWLLMLLRCLLLLMVIVYLASLFIAWRGDTVLVGDDLDPLWLQQQLKETGMQNAKQRRFCARTECDVQSSQLLYWLAEHQKDWQVDARILILARAGQLAWSAESPQLLPKTEIRVQDYPLKAPVRTHYIALRSDHPEVWQSLFRAFSVAGDGQDRYVWQQQADAKTDLIIWDSNQSVPSNWQAPYWWMKRPAKELPKDWIAQNNPALAGLALHQYQRGKVRYWLTEQAGQWPMYKLEETKQWYRAWQQSRAQQVDLIYTGMQLPRAQVSQASQQENTRQLLLLCLLVIFALERMLSHVKRL
jgi:hypothetical protein